MWSSAALATLCVASAIASNAEATSYRAGSPHAFRQRTGVQPEVQPSYDFVIVGGGTAGLALAARLTESGDQSVLVLEAGQDPNIVQQYKPPGADQTVLGSPIDWGFVTQPEDTLKNRTITYNRGRCLGGSSAINGLTYDRGSSTIYDLWQSLGNSNWSWSNVYPLFKKSTHFVPSKLDSEYDEYDPELYSDGPVQVGYAGYVTPAAVAFVDALSAVNVSSVVDLNSGYHVGAKQETLTLDANYQRSSSYDNYYQLARNRTNLTVRTLSPVHQLLLSQTNGTLTATGVVFTEYDTGNTVNVTANKEVILSAGAIQTPQLMMLSGIGPFDVMQKAGVNQIYLNNSNVGQHLQDHTYFSIYVRAQTSTSYTALYNNVYNIQQATAEYQTNRSGQLTAPIGPSFAFEQISLAELEELNATDIINSNRTNQAHTEYLLETTYYPNTPIPQYFPQPGESYISLTAAIVAPQSRGSVTLRSNAWEDAPFINLNYLEAETDQKIQIRNFRKLRQILAHPALQNLTIGPDNGEVAPGPSVQTDEEILDYIRTDSWTVWHACGTTRMLPEDQGGVVDDRLRVYGVKGLRVVDAGVIPVITDTHPQAAVYMIAEKAAQMIKEDYGF